MHRSPRRRALAAALLSIGLGLGLAAPARACDPELIEPRLDDADGQMALAVQAESLSGAQVHLRRAALLLGEAEAQFHSCGCNAALFEVGAAIAESRRAAAAQQVEEFAIAVEAAIDGLMLTREALGADLCY